MHSSAALRRPGQVLLSCLFLFPLACNNQTPQPEKAPPAPVTAERAEEEELTETAELFGMTQPLPNNAAPISANVSALVRAIRVDEKGKPLKEGQFVGQNDVIVQLDDRIIQRQREGAQIALELAQKEVERLQTLRKDPQTRSSAPQYELDKAELQAKR